MRRLRMVMALDRVGHSLSDAMPGLEATQKTSPIIGHSAAYNSNQFRVYWNEVQKHLLFRPNEIADCAIHRTNFLSNRCHAGGIKSSYLLSGMEITTSDMLSPGTSRIVKGPCCPP